MLQNQKQSIIRNSSIELLRIIAMIMIVFHHFAVHGGFSWESSSVSFTRHWYNLIIMGGKIGVDVFVIISGYYLINSNSGYIKFDKIAKFVGQVFFYSVTLYLISCLTGISDLNIKSLIKVLFPITFSQWWFASTYFVLFLLHPFLNRLLHVLDQAAYQKLLLVLVICWSVIPTFTTSSFQGNSLLWFITLYSISGYIRLYGLNSKFTAKHYFIFLLIGSLLTYGSSIAFTMLGKKWSFFSARATYFYGQEKITTLLTSLCLFMLFVTIKMNYHRWINVVASATFGVYLIHDNNIVRPLLWESWFKNAQYQESLYLIPYSIIAVTIVYVVCTFIDLLRQKLIDKPFLIIVNRYSAKIMRPVNILIDLVMNIVFGKQD